MADTEENLNILARLEAIEAYIAGRQEQQLSYPLDLASRSVLEEIRSEGKGSTTKTQVYTDSAGNTVAAPKAYAATWLLRLADGTLIEVPSLV